MLAAYLCWMLSATCFVHTHDFSWGKVTHSHPYSDSHHTHSQGACSLIDYLDGAAAESAADAVSPVVDSAVSDAVCLADVPAADSFSCVRSLRAPPVFPLS